MSDAVIPFTFVRLKTLVDGGLRIEVDVPEIHQPDAFKIFKTGADGAFVRLNEGVASGPTKNGTDKLVEVCEDPRPVKKRRMNPTEVRAINLCNNPNFGMFLWLTHLHYITNVQDRTKKVIVSFIKGYCGVEHRYQIEKSKDAAMKFGEIEAEFEAWQKKNAPW